MKIRMENEELRFTAIDMARKEIKSKKEKKGTGFFGIDSSPEAIDELLDLARQKYAELLKQKETIIKK